MLKTRPVNLIKQFFCYVLGLLIIAVGVNISKLSGLGISPVSSIPRACEVVWGFTMGTAVIILYILLILLQLVLLRKKFRLTNALGVPVAFLFGWMVDLVGIDEKAFGHLLLHFPRPEAYPLRLLYLAASILIIGLGVFLYLRPKWVPMPAEGLAGAISATSGKPFGDCKTLVDTSMITIALILQLVFLGGLASFTGENIVVREGTVLSALLVGQIVKLLTKWLGKPLEAWLRKGDAQN